MKRWIWLAFLAVCLPLAIRAGTPEEDKKVIESLKKDYPMEVCVVSGEKLGEMGEPIDYLYTQKVDGTDQTRLVRFCCKGCVKSFKKDPAKYLKQLDEAAAKKK